MVSESTQDLTEDCLFYTAFRAAWLSTFDSLLDEFLTESNSSNDLALFRHIPILNGCAPQVQLHLLMETWNRLKSTELSGLNVSQQCVCFSAFSELARVSASSDQRMIQRIQTGPKANINTDNDVSFDGQWLASRSRALQIVLPFSPQAAVLELTSAVAQEDQQDIRSGGGVCADDMQILEDLNGRWRIPQSILLAGDGLISSHERQILVAFFEEHPELIEQSGSDE